MLATTTNLVAQHLTDQTWYIVTSDIGKVIFSVLGLILAYRGLSTWKKQIKGGKEFNTAYNLNYSILELRKAVKYVRNPFIWPNEILEAERQLKNKNPNIGQESLEKNKYPYVYRMRWEKITEAQVKMESHQLAAEVLWGKEILNLIEPLNKKITEFSIALSKNFSEKRMEAEEYEKIDKIIYADVSGTGTDSYLEEMNQIIDKIKTYISKKL